MPPHFASGSRPTRRSALLARNLLPTRLLGLGFGRAESSRKPASVVTYRWRLLLGSSGIVIDFGTA